MDFNMKFCNPECMYLNPKENMQGKQLVHSRRIVISKRMPKYPHVCTRYYKIVKHEHHHPNIVALTYCKENKNGTNKISVNKTI